MWGVVKLNVAILHDESKILKTLTRTKVNLLRIRILVFIT